MSSSSGAAVEAIFDEYVRCYERHDAAAVADRCATPFLAVRGEDPIPLLDREAVVAHFADIFSLYRDLGVTTWSATSIDPHPLGSHAAFATVRWHALSADGAVVRDSVATYHLLFGAEGWRFLSYTFHG